jgi:DNA-directed RNA polymerase specialized sigma24 family protein
LEKPSLPNQDLPQLYRFCFLMLGDAGKAQDIFQTIMHDAALRAAAGELPNDRLSIFRDARYRCLEASEAGLQAEAIELEEHQIDSNAPAQIAKLEPAQLAIWISNAPDPQRTALALFYLDEFDHQELVALSELSTAELANRVGNGRQEFQAWLNATFPDEQPFEEQT